MKGELSEDFRWKHNIGAFNRLIISLSWNYIPDIDILYSSFTWYIQIMVILINLCRCKPWISSRLQAAKRLKERLSIDNILWWLVKYHCQICWLFVTFRDTFDADSYKSHVKPNLRLLHCCEIWISSFGFVYCWIMVTMKVFAK